MNLVSLEKLNALRFTDDPQPMQKLWRWCREGRLPARKIGGEWFVDLDEFDGKVVKNQEPTVAFKVLDLLR